LTSIDYNSEILSVTLDIISNLFGDSRKEVRLTLNHTIPEWTTKCLIIAKRTMNQSNLAVLATIYQNFLRSRIKSCLSTDQLV